MVTPRDPAVMPAKKKHPIKITANIEIKLPMVSRMSRNVLSIMYLMSSPRKRSFAAHAAPLPLDIVHRYALFVELDFFHPAAAHVYDLIRHRRDCAVVRYKHDSFFVVRIDVFEQL